MLGFSEPVPHARIRRIDTSAALAIPGVVAVLTGEDLPKPARPRAKIDPRRAPTLCPKSRWPPSLSQGEPICGGSSRRQTDGGWAIEKLKVG